MAKRDELATALDHPIFFVLLMTLLVFSTAAIFAWGAKAAGLPGLAAIFD
jgi:hypothetical protein